MTPKQIELVQQSFVKLIPIQEQAAEVFFTRMFEIDPNIKIMFITGFAAVALNPTHQAPKDAKILSKPFHLRELVQEVERLMEAA